MKASQPQRVESLTEDIRKLVFEPRTLALFLKHRPAEYSQLCSALDTISDIELALEAYARTPDPESDGATYLLVYGVLQLLYVEQDAVHSLAKAFRLEHQRGQLLQEVRDARNDSTGHPTNSTRRGEGRSFNFINRSTMSRGGFELRTMYEDQREDRVMSIQIPALITKQREGICQLLETILAELQRQENEHRMTFRAQRLQDHVPDVLSYYFEKVFDAIRKGPGYAAFGAGHVRLVQEHITELTRLMAERDPAGGYDAVTYELERINYPLEQLLDFFSADGTGRLTDRDADIFVWYAKDRADTLRSITKEMDTEYATDLPAESPPAHS